VKYVFLLVLLLVVAAGGVMGAAIVWRFSHDMTQTARIDPGERVFPMPRGVVARDGELLLPREQRAAAARRPNPIPPTPQSVAEGRQHFMIFCAPCHGPEGRGGVTGPVATRFIPPPDLTNPELQKQRTDGYWQHYIRAGGAVMPGYAEALSAEEAWHIVNFLRTLAAR